MSIAPESTSPTRSVVITGASSGIGHALALHYARRGTHLGLLGRNRDRLLRVAAECRSRGATVDAEAIDVRSRGAMAAWLDAYDRRFPIDLLFANAGVMDGTPVDGAIEPADAAYEIVETNVLGVLNTVQPAIPRMMARQRGQIVILSSLAGLIPLRDSPSYCASKSAVLAYGLSLRDLLIAHGIRVNVICPGYVATPMSRQEIGSKPFEISAGRAASLIARGLARNKPVIAFPFWLALGTRIGAMLPDALRERVTRGSRFRVNRRT
jgi:short-subunit dehydrogenase